MSHLTPKMSHFPKIPYETCIKISRQSLYDLFHVKNMTQLENSLQLTDGTLSKALPETPLQQTRLKGKRGISANIHQKLLEAIASQFSSSEDMRLWLKKHWPEELRLQTKDFLQALYEKIDLDGAFPQSGIFPADYVERDEKQKILDVLLTQKDIQVCWVTGPGGCGKSTLALSLARHNLKQDFKHVFWVNVDGRSFSNALTQIANGLNLSGIGEGDTFSKIQALTSKHKTLFILDAVHDVPDLLEWRRLAGYLGKLVVTSRVHLSDADLRADGKIAQIELRGFNKQQARQFMGDESAETDDLISFTEGLPLALRTLRGLMDEMKLSPKEVLPLLSRKPMDVMDALPVSLRSCFDLTWQFLIERHPEALDYFRAAGLFHTNMIQKAALEQAAAISDPVVGDQYARLLKRYSLLDVVAVEPFRFEQETHRVSMKARYIKLHSLAHAYAREKRLGTERYWDAITEMTHAAENDSSSEISLFSNVTVYHWADILKTYWYWREMDGEEEANYKIGGMTENALSLMRDQILYGNGLAQIPIAEVGNTLHIWILNEYGERLLHDFKNKNLKSPAKAEESMLQEVKALFQYARQLELPPAHSMEAVKEKCKSVIGLADCILQEGHPLEARELLHSEASEKFLSQCADDTILMKRDILLAEICVARQKYREALGHIRAARRWENYFSFRMELYRLMAKCYRSLGMTWRAKLIYSGVFWRNLIDRDAHINDGLMLADCLLERGEALECLVATHKLEELLADLEKFESFWIPSSRLWRYRAQAYNLLGREQKARAAEQKSREYLQCIEDL